MKKTAADTVSKICVKIGENVESKDLLVLVLVWLVK